MTFRGLAESERTRGLVEPVLQVGRHHGPQVGEGGRGGRQAQAPRPPAELAAMVGAVGRLLGHGVRLMLTGLGVTVGVLQGRRGGGRRTGKRQMAGPPRRPIARAVAGVDRRLVALDGHGAAAV